MWGEEGGDAAAPFYPAQGTLTIVKSAVVQGPMASLGMENPSPIIML